MADKNSAVDSDIGCGLGSTTMATKPQ